MNTKPVQVIDQELEDAFKDLYKDTHHTAWELLNNPIHPLYSALLNFKAGATWKAEQSANDAIEFHEWMLDNNCYYSGEKVDKTSWYRYNGKDYLLKQLYDLWQQNKKK